MCFLPQRAGYVMQSSNQLIIHHLNETERMSEAWHSSLIFGPVPCDLDIAQTDQ